MGPVNWRSWGSQISALGFESHSYSLTSLSLSYQSQSPTQHKSNYSEAKNLAVLNISFCGCCLYFWVCREMTNYPVLCWYYVIISYLTQRKPCLSWWSFGELPRAQGHSLCHGSKFAIQIATLERSLTSLSCLVSSCQGPGIGKQRSHFWLIDDVWCLASSTRAQAFLAASLSSRMLVCLPSPLSSHISEYEVGLVQCISKQRLPSSRVSVSVSTV